MASRYGTKYAVHLINNHFGDLVSKVCECLLQRGPLTLEEIGRFTSLKPDKVRDSLLVLIQHNCVQSFTLGGFSGDPTEDEAAPKTVTNFVPIFGHIIHRGRFEKFLAIIKQEFDEQCYDLMEGLFQNGRLSLKQLQDRCGQLSKAKDVDAVIGNLNKLVMSRYVERCPKPEPNLSPPEDEEPAPKKRGSLKGSKITVVPETLEQRVLAAAMPPDAMRFLIPSCNGPDGEDSGSTISGEKRKRATVDEEEQNVVWRPNFEEFVFRLRHKACIEIVRENRDDQAALVFSAMVDASKKEEKRVKAKKSVNLSLDSIYEEVIKSEKGRNLTIDLVKATLVGLSADAFIRIDSESYTIDYKHIIEEAQTAEVESVVSKRYGGDAYRMFRYLSKTDSMVETDKILGDTLVGKTGTTKHLFRMMQDGYLVMERIQAGAQFLLWKVNKPLLFEQVLNEMFHAALNLSLRTKHEKEQTPEVITILFADLLRLLWLGSLFPVFGKKRRRDSMPKERKEKLRRVQLLLYSSLVKLDDAIMIFHNF